MIHRHKETRQDHVQQNQERDVRFCVSCGGQLERKNPYLYQCSSCKRTYYISANRKHRISVRLSAGRVILFCAIAAIVITALAMMGYQYYTGRLVVSASRFCVVFRDFLIEAYEKPVAEIRAEDLARIRYLKIERDKKYRFTYSYEDYYGFQDADSFEKGRIAGLQEAILAIMEENGPVTDQMRRDVINNTHHDSLINWVKSFR